MNAIKKLGVVASATFLTSPAFAAADLTPIQDAQADLLAYGGALLALGVAVWGVMKVVRMFGGK